MTKICRCFFPLSFFVLNSTSLFAQQNNFWASVNEPNVEKNLFDNRLKPSAYKLFHLNDAAFKLNLAGVPSEKTVSVSNSFFVVSFPNAEGLLEQYKVVEAPVMHPDLAAKYPGIKSYAGACIENPGSIIRFDVSPQGFHGMILSANRNTIYIDPLDTKNNYYMVVERKDLMNDQPVFNCLTTAKIHTENNSDRTAAVQDADDGKLRIYRLALCASGEFSKFYLNGTETTDAQRKAKVLAAQNSHMTRANAIFERDLGVRLVLVANNDAVIFLDPVTDPWGDLNSATQTTCDNIIGDANYDIGHLEHKANNDGNAGCIACACVSGSKGSGFTSYSNPSLLEFFVVDYLSHELGHQLGASHTFTHTNEGTNVQIEPGSGVTIMGYAGITGATDVQPHSDAYFHSKSIEQISNYIKTGGGASCAQVTVTGNTAPTANAGADYIIPNSTPFKLTGSGTDIDAGDILTYNWEQIDNMAIGSSTIPIATATAGPQFRPYLPTTSSSRTIPEINSILNGTNVNTWEVLPSVARVLNFRFIVRDNHPSAGNDKSDDMVLTISGSSGPFAVSAPNTALIWNTGTLQTVTWTVNGSNSTPVNCANVNILLSIDGGLTFPVTLAANTPNDGSQIITVPAITSAACRVKVEAVGNIFFDISNTNFIIAIPTPDFIFDNPGAMTVGCNGPTSAVITLGVLSILGYNTPVNLSASGVPPGTTVSFGTTPVIPGGSTVVTLNNTNTLSFGTYSVTITGVSGVITKTRILTYIIQPGAGPLITLQPISQSACVGNNATFSLTASGANSYQWQISTDGGGLYDDIFGATSSSFTAPNVIVAQNNNTYRCIITGQCNTTISNGATLTVWTLPTVNLSVSPYTRLFPGLTTTITASTVPASGVTLTWFRNGILIPGVSGKTYSLGITGLGDYKTDIVDVNGCNNQSQVLTIADSVSTRLFVFPSPNNGQFTVAYYNPGGAITQQVIAVYNSLGAKVYNAKLAVAGPYQLHSINIKPAARGIYYVVVGDSKNKKLAGEKIIIH